jgi:hypothetical protein
LTATANTATPGAQTIAVNTTDGVRGVTMETFDLKSTTGDSQLDSLRVYVKTDSGTYSAPTALYLYDGSTILGSGSVTVTNGSGYVDFTSLTVKILKDQIKTLTIKADFPSTAVGVASTTIRTSAAETNTTMYETADATTKEVTIASEIVGNDVHLYATAAPAWTLVSSSIVSSAGVVDVASSSITGTIVLSVKANGGSTSKLIYNGIFIFNSQLFSKEVKRKEGLQGTLIQDNRAKTSKPCSFSNSKDLKGRTSLKDSSCLLSNTFSVRKVQLLHDST